MRYVDAGYVAALGTMFVYGLSLVLRRRRWERARQVAQGDAGVAPAAEVSGPTAAPGGRP